MRLSHEFYTPSKVAKEVARVVAPLVHALPQDGETVHALEPSAGIGRFLRAFEAVPGLTWHAVEWSTLSSLMLKALRPDLDLTNAPFERWVREKSAGAAGRLGLVVSNPPYGIRGASVAEDPDRAYREKMAYHYFLRRGLDLLAPDGLGVFLVPGGFLTSRTAQFTALRERVLKRHHLAAAYRLPSINEKRREAIFPGAMLVTDLLFFRARGGELDAVDASDAEIVGGGYFKQFPRHILGREVGEDHGEDDQTSKPRWGYQVQGEFTRLPDLVERPVCGDCKVVAFPSRSAAPAPAGRIGVTRVTEADVTDLPREFASAVLLGLRVDRYLALLAAENAEEPPLLWPELHAALTAWHGSNGNPHASVELVKLARGGNTGAERFLSAFDRAGHLIDGLRRKPPVFEPRYTGRVDDVVAEERNHERSSRRYTPPPYRRSRYCRKRIGVEPPSNSEPHPPRFPPSRPRARSSGIREHRVGHPVVHPGEVAEGLRLLVVVAVAVAIFLVVVVPVVHLGLDERAEGHAAEHDASELRVAAAVEDLVDGDVGDLGTPLADHGVDGVQLLELQIVDHGRLSGEGGAQFLSILTLSRYRKSLELG